MDTSETYIQMCHCAFPKHEIVPSGKVQKVECNIYVDGKGQWWADCQGWFIPFYRQDQLQEMVKEVSFGYHSKPVFWLRNLFSGFANGYLVANLPNAEQFTSMEQLWLAFAMKELYQKVWSGTDWIVSN